MRIDKIYCLYCSADCGELYSPLFTTRREAIDYLDDFKYEILEDNDNELEDSTQIELVEINLEFSKDSIVEDHGCFNTLSSWLERVDEGYWYWHDMALVSRIKEREEA